METVKIESLKKSFGKVEVLKGINLVVRAGETTAVLGPNASGKTTLLKCILGLVIPSEGRVYVKGMNVMEGPHYRRYIGYMPQEPSFPPNLTPLDLVELISEVRKTDPGDEMKRLAELFRLERFMNRPIGTLSGGTKQKVNALLSLCFSPEVLILDEPTVGLDPVASSKLKEEIVRQKERGRTVLITSHIMGEVEELADRVVLLIDGDVRIDETVEELKDRTGAPNLEKAIATLLEEEVG